MIALDSKALAECIFFDILPPTMNSLFYYEFTVHTSSETPWFFVAI